MQPGQGTSKLRCAGQLKSHTVLCASMSRSSSCIIFDSNRKTCHPTCDIDTEITRSLAISIQPHQSVLLLHIPAQRLTRRFWDRSSYTQNGAVQAQGSQSGVGNCVRNYCSSDEFWIRNQCGMETFMPRRLGADWISAVGWWDLYINSC